ncbi:hypothetical protein [Variovorax boronicumulans]|uniref:hypothetical protein n=1 Tax=Variovorax boronicumulans TaxID=436515 RepID=UPI002787C85F|nr:hypothetical protein [Variovorax boronicumulans]MDQ0040378.1 hypothetical protein [Variovorax boronicumulans]
MATPLASSILQLLLGVDLAASDGTAGNRFAIEGLAWGPEKDGTASLRIEQLEAASLHLTSGELTLEIGRVAVRGLVAQIRSEAGAPQLVGVEACEAEFSGLKLHGPLRMPPRLHEAWTTAHATAPAAEAPAAQAPADATSLAPLGTAHGTIRGKITDAHLLFDADVTLPLRGGQIDFNDATVEHVGPDSRMGVSRLGIYVDAPDGRSYIYQFASAPLAGVTFERRGALLSPWISERGKLQLQAFAESMLRSGRGQGGSGLTEQARLLLGRTSLSGDLQLGDGVFALSGLQGRLEGRDAGRNRIGLHSEAVGRGVMAEIDSLSVRDAAAAAKNAHLRCDTLQAKLKLQLVSEGAEMRFVLDLGSGTAAGLRFDRSAPQPDKR